MEEVGCVDKMADTDCRWVVVDKILASTVSIYHVVTMGERVNAHQHTSPVLSSQSQTGKPRNPQLSSLNRGIQKSKQSCLRQTQNIRGLTTEWQKGLEADIRYSRQGFQKERKSESNLENSLGSDSGQKPVQSHPNRYDAGQMLLRFESRQSGNQWMLLK